MSVRTIDRDQLRQKIDRGDRFVLIEVLAPDDYARGHLPGAVNVPWKRLAEVPQMVPDRNAEVVFYCASPT
jgi:rhodanese-related sulfurtransferase